MSEPVDPVLLARGDSETATDWARHGLAPAYVAGMPRGWVAIAPSGTDAQSAPPYNDAADVLFGRSLPRTLRPALGLRVVGARLVVSVDLGGRWSRRGWLAWEPGTGVLWTVVNERDGLGDETPPDYLSSVREGGFYLSLIHI